MVEISTLVLSEYAEEINGMAAASGNTVRDFLRVCIEDTVNGHYVFNGDHLVPTDEYLDALRPRGFKTGWKVSKD